MRARPGVFAAALALALSCAAPAARAQSSPGANTPWGGDPTVPLSITVVGTVPYRVRVSDVLTTRVAFECTTPCTRAVAPGRLQLAGGGPNLQPFREVLEVTGETHVSLRPRPLNAFARYRGMLGAGVAGTIVGVLVNLFVGGWYFVGGCPYYALGTQPGCDTMATVLAFAAIETGAGLATALAAGAFRPGNAIDRVERGGAGSHAAAGRPWWSPVVAPVGGGATFGAMLRF